ncbi:Kinetochore protein fta4 [Escovopsis weberi]|uniref:Kinetochore protein fta4 n=1 Tax=Escovopsis weberi TaxID=150374 RepID=A0A0M8N4X3_ESCWE|nr:Kinetochore protein fta4 [Escovopsis weberi]
MATIPAVKQSFLAAQTQLLAQPLAPSRAWLAGNSAGDAPLPEALVREALAGVNQAVVQHARRAYAPLASRNVAEQIEELYGREGADEGAEGDGIDRGCDLKELPDERPEREAHEYPAEAHRYRAAVARLRELSERREALAVRVGRLRRVRAAVEDLRTGDGGAGLQENLATRGSAVERELERMRLLMGVEEFLDERVFRDA